jgi:hypothetical protein
MVLWIAVIRWSVPGLATTPIRVIGAFVAIYFIVEILIFSVHWVFVETARLHSVARSLAAFIVNLLEIGLLSSIALVLLDCAPSSTSQWTIVYQHLATTFGLQLMPTVSRAVCGAVTHLELITAGTVLTIAVASLVGGVLRDAVGQSDGAA